MLTVGVTSVEERVFTGGLKKGWNLCLRAIKAPRVCLFSSPRAKLLNQSQPAEVALARNCVVSVSHISGVAAVADALKKKKL